MRKRLALPLAGIAGLAVAVVPALAAEQSIEVKDNQFSPNAVTVDAGDRVTITNPPGGNPHNVKWEDRGAGDPAAPSASWTVEREFGPGDAGRTINFACEVHASMTGTVTVRAGGGTTTPSQPTQTGTTGTSTAPPPGGGGTTTGTTTPALPPPSSDDDAPTLSGVRGSATRRAVTVRVGLDEAGKVVLTVSRNGRRVVRRTFERSGSGATTLRIRRRFPRGRLVVRVQAVDAAGNRSRARTLRLRVR